MNGDKPRDGESGITDSFNNRRSWAKSGHSRREHTEPASNGFSGHVPVRDDSEGPQVTSIGTDIGNFFKVLFAFFKGIWTQDFADFDLLSSVYFPPQPKSEVEVPAPQQQIIVPKPQVPQGKPESKTPGETQKKGEEKPGQKQQETPGPSASSEGTGEKPPASTKPAEETSQQKLSPTQDFKGTATPSEKPLSSGTQEKTAPVDQRSLMQKSVDTMREMRADPNHPDWKLPLGKLTEKLTKGIERPSKFDDMIKQILLIEGGDKVNRNEPNGGISKYGINSIANPGVDVENLTEKEAIKIIREKYWQNIQWPTGDASKMSQAVQFLALDTAINSQSYANKLLDESYKKARGDITKMPDIMLDMRTKRFESLAKENPKKYQAQLEGWKKRVDTLRELVSHYALTVPTPELTAKLAILRPVDFPTTSHFGLRDDPFTHKHGTHHLGTDYKTPMNSPVPAKLDGEVFKATTFNGYGKTLIVSHGNGMLYQVYAHLDQILVKEGQHVSPGTIMAKTGQSGRATGPHLHHELWIREGNKFYVIDELDAISKDLSNPAVRRDLIKHSPEIEPSLMKNEAFRKAALENTGNGDGLNGALVAAAPGSSKPELATR
ncbi:MAG TPA: peptidoglycan DD-metalloendopeptidase family protein [Alphaproteobacteria bacterium]|nr:peptidoglycan DD-metalloendopeptidase family protein [Micavibrio sp.]HQX26882.1 peptidoglycan DD-metalloendopeptidase family protein [Alphaproteobacteria bacterium]